MSSKLINRKDIIYRNSCSKNKNFIYFNKLLKNDKRIPKKTRWNLNVNQKKFESLLVNHCVFTGRTKGVDTKNKLTRMAFKMLALNGYLNGYKKGSW